MGPGRSIGVAHHAKALFQAGRLGDHGDAALLDLSMGFDSDPAIRETAFSALVERHGPMVLRVCEVIVGNFQEAEDAFQATFLVLAREAPRSTIRDSLGPWLHAVAVRISLYARRARARRHRHERTWALQASARSITDSGAQDGLERDEAICMVQTEIARLPKRLRSCVVLCDLEGLTYAQAARQLNLPLGTVQSRLARARFRLRERLTRLGLGPDQSGGQDAHAGIQLPPLGLVLRPHLLKRTTRTCLEFATSSTTAGGLVTSSIAALLKGGIGMLFWSKLTRCGLVTFLCLLVGGLALHSQTGSQNRRDSPQSRKPGTAVAQVLPLPKPTLVIAAPKELRATGGRGKLLVYDLDPTGERTRVGIMDSRNRTGVEWTKQVEREYSWVVLTGVVDHQANRESARQSRSGSPDSPAFYRRVDLERQSWNLDESWSSWISVDPTPTIRVLDNIPEEDVDLIEPLVPELVDPLPYFKQGKWQGVNVERLVPARKEERPHGQLPPNVQGMMVGAPARPRQLPPELMLRSLDFSVSPGQTYRYRARVVADARPRFGRLKEVLGEWSRPTDAVTVP